MVFILNAYPVVKYNIMKIERKQEKIIWKIVIKLKKHQLQNRDQINTRMNEYFKNRIKSDVNFQLIGNTRRRIHHALNGKTKSSSATTKF